MVRSQCVCGVFTYAWYSGTNRHKRLDVLIYVCSQESQYFFVGASVLLGYFL